MWAISLWISQRPLRHLDFFFVQSAQFKPIVRRVVPVKCLSGRTTIAKTLPMAFFELNF